MMKLKCVLVYMPMLKLQAQVCACFKPHPGLPCKKKQELHEKVSQTKQFEMGVLKFGSENQQDVYNYV